MKFILSKHLNLAQIYMSDTVYLTEYSTNLATITRSIRSTIVVEHIVKKSVKVQLLHYTYLRSTSQIVRNDMTTMQQHQLTQRIVSARKLKEIRTIGHGRSRKLKSSEFPELATVLTYTFGELEGGLEAHPRLTTGTVYRASDNTMPMKTAREVLLSLAPEGFIMSLSSCFNYTQNYRKGSIQSKQHHAGKDVNCRPVIKKASAHRCGTVSRELALVNCKC